MATTKSLKELREAKMEAIEALMKEAEAQEKGYTPEQETRFDSLTDEVKDLDAQIVRSEEKDAMAQRLAEMKSRKAPAVHKNKSRDNEDTLQKKFNLSKAIHDIAYGGGLTGAEREMHEEGVKQNKGATGNLQVPTFTRDLLADTTGDGEEMIGVDVHSPIPFLYGKRLITSFGAQVWRGLDFDYKIPLVSATGSVAWEGEGDTNAEADLEFTPKTLTPKRLGATTDVSKQLLIQARNANVNKMVTDNLRTLIDNAVEVAALIGGGTGEPSGIIDVLTATVSATAVPTYANILALETAVATNNAEMGNIGYITNPYIRSVLKTVDVGTDTGFFVWDGRYMNGDRAVFGEGQVNSYRAATTTLIGGGAASATNYVIYGNWRDLIIGQFGGLDLLINPYTKSKEALVEITANMWVDSAMLHNASFAYSVHDLS